MINSIIIEENWAVIKKIISDVLVYQMHPRINQMLMIIIIMKVIYKQKIIIILAMFIKN